MPQQESLQYVQPVTQALDAAQISGSPEDAQQIRSKAYKAFFSSGDVKSFAGSLDAVQGLPDATKAQLLSIKFPQAGKMIEQAKADKASTPPSPQAPAAPAAAPQTPRSGSPSIPGMFPSSQQGSQAPPLPAEYRPSAASLFSAATTPLAESIFGLSPSRSMEAQNKQVESTLPSWYKPIHKAISGVNEASVSAAEGMTSPAGLMTLGLGPLLSKATTELPGIVRMTGRAFSAASSLASAGDATGRLYRFFTTGDPRDLGRAAVDIPLAIMGGKAALRSKGNAPRQTATPNTPAEPVGYGSWRDTYFRRGPSGQWEDRFGQNFTDERLREMHLESAGGQPTSPNGQTIPAIGGSAQSAILPSAQTTQVPTAKPLPGWSPSGDVGKLRADALSAKALAERWNMPQGGPLRNQPPAAAQPKPPAPPPPQPPPRQIAGPAGAHEPPPGAMPITPIGADYRSAGAFPQGPRMIEEPQPKLGYENLTHEENLDYARQMPKEILGRNIDQMRVSAAQHAAEMLKQAKKDPTKLAEVQKWVEETKARLDQYQGVYDEIWGGKPPSPKPEPKAAKPETELAKPETPKPTRETAPRKSKEPTAMSNVVHESANPPRPESNEPPSASEKVITSHLADNLKAAASKDLKNLKLTISRGSGKDLVIGVNAELDTPEELAKTVMKHGGANGMATLESTDPERPVSWKFLIGEAPQ